MLRLIVKLHEILTLLKDFKSMYSSSSKDKMIIEHENKFYLIKIEELDEVEDIQELTKELY